MFNLQPGQGLGSSASRELAFGLGPYIIVPPAVQEPVVHGERIPGTGGGGGKKFLTSSYEEQNRIFAQIAKEDQEILEIIIASVTSGVLH